MPRKRLRPAWCLLWLIAALAACKGPAREGSPERDLQALRTVADTYPRYADRVRRVDKAKLVFGDGDTFSVGELTIRILGIDTPEVRNPEHGFFEDQPYGRQASKLAKEILGRAQVIEYLPFDRDRYGRLLAHVFVDGELFGARMIQTHLACESVSFYGDNGFPDLAEELLRTAEKAGRPPFREPRLWRREQRP